uniref:UDP-N-acetylglucosamine--peptide N-acetylglucosaminyltransferase SPINDLY n=1 Tax=Trichuris muris TaxID=70415 RepID=A0A5S6Q5S1_TRIMR
MGETENTTDDLYSGFSEIPSFLQSQAASASRSSALDKASTFLRTPTGRKLTSGRTKANGPLTFVKPPTATRPSSSLLPAGYSSHGQAAQYDSVSIATRTSGSPLTETIEEKFQKMEAKVTSLLEASLFAYERNDSKHALEYAKEAVRRERAIVKLREQQNLIEETNVDLTFCALFNLAQQYSSNSLFPEALKMYEALTKNKMFTTAGDLLINTGNIYMQKQQYISAIRHYQLALERVPNVQKIAKQKIRVNMGVAYFKLKRYKDAMECFEEAMQIKSDFRIGMNMLLCALLLEDWQQLKTCFVNLLDIQEEWNSEAICCADPEDPTEAMVVAAFRNDMLSQWENSKKQRTDQVILNAASLLAPKIQPNYEHGYSWCVEMIKKSKHAAIADELELNKAVRCLHNGRIDEALIIFKKLEKKESRSSISALNNIAMLYFLQGDLKEAEELTERALASDRYNACALVNRGNISFRNGEYEVAREYYREAWSNEANCIEALYNLALVCRQLERFDEAMECLQKMRNVVLNNPHVLVQVARLYEVFNSNNQAIECYTQAHVVAPDDPSILRKLGELHEKIGDKQQAFHFFLDSYRLYPCCLETTEWLAAYYVEKELSEKAIEYFEQAALIQPDEVKWHLMVANCLRRSGNYTKALQRYREAHAKFPDDTNCLEQLLRAAKDLGLTEATEYAEALKKAERSKIQRMRDAQRTMPTKSSRSANVPTDRQLQSGAGKATPSSKTTSDVDTYPQSRHADTASSVHSITPASQPSTASKRNTVDKLDWLDNDSLLDILLPE